jgi:hypothetical protein
MAQPIIVTAVTTESGAALGPSEDHGMRPYSRKAGGVKIVRLQIRSQRRRASRFSDLKRADRQPRLIMKRAP